MGWTITQFQETPNPNALKCALDRPIAEVPKSYSSASAAAGDPVAARLFSIPGVTNLLIHPTWITVNKSPDVPWKSIKPAVAKALESLP
jgi:hypothetical protein